MGGHSAPMPYQPANQAGADSAMYGNLQQNTANNQSLWATAWPAYNTGVQNIANNPGKGPLFTPAHRLELVKASTTHLPNVSATLFDFA